MRRALDGRHLHGRRRQGSKDQAQARLWAYRDPASFQHLIDLLVETSIAYLLGQVEAGAGALQIFDSWAGSLPDDEFAHWCSYPTRAIVAGVKAEAPHIPIIGFPRGCGAGAERYAQETGIDAIGCDTSMPLGFICENLQSRLPVQGNLDPLLLLTGGEHLERRVRAILDTLGGGPVHLQPRPRHPARDAAGARRRACRARERQIAMLLYVKAFHVIAIIAWMAGLLYLPRLFVYHAERAERLGAVARLSRSWSGGCSATSPRRP